MGDIIRNICPNCGDKPKAYEESRNIETIDKGWAYRPETWATGLRVKWVAQRSFCHLCNTPYTTVDQRAVNTTRFKAARKSAS